MKLDFEINSHLSVLGAIWWAAEARHKVVLKSKNTYFLKMTLSGTAEHIYMFCISKLSKSDFGLLTPEVKEVKAYSWIHLLYFLSALFVSLLSCELLLTLAILGARR